MYNKYQTFYFTIVSNQNTALLNLIRKQLSVFCLHEQLVGLNLIVWESVLASLKCTHSHGHYLYDLTICHVHYCTSWNVDYKFKVTGKEECTDDSYAPYIFYNI